MGEPYCLPITRIRRMTDAGIWFLLFHPRKEDGRLDRESEWTGEADYQGLLRIPKEAWDIARTIGVVGMATDFVSMWWSVARSQQKKYGWDDEYVLAAFLKYAESERRQEGGYDTGQAIHGARNGR